MIVESFISGQVITKILDEVQPSPKLYEFITSVSGEKNPINSILNKVCLLGESSSGEISKWNGKKHMRVGVRFNGNSKSFSNPIVTHKGIYNLCRMRKGVIYSSNLQLDTRTREDYSSRRNVTYLAVPILNSEDDYIGQVVIIDCKKHDDETIQEIFSITKSLSIMFPQEEKVVDELFQDMVKMIEEREVIVERPVEIEKIVEREVIVERPVEVEKIVEREVIVERPVEVEKIKIVERNNFMVSLSHDIRTPLNGIVGVTTLLKDTDPTEKQEKYLKLLQSCTIQLMDLFNDIIDYSKATTKKLVLNNDELYLDEMLNRAIDVITPNLNKLKLEVDIKKGVPKTIVGDSKRLTQIIVNLLTNALRYANKKIKVSIDSYIVNPEASVQSDKKYRLTFKIKNDGKIIEDTHSIFEPYVGEGNPGHHGLGLAICKELISLMGGTIWAEKDGTFVFTIIAPEVMVVEDILKIHKEMLSKLKIIIVDKKIEDRMLLSSSLIKWGMNPLTFSTVQEAIHYLKMKKGIDMAIIDHYTDGYIMAKKIKSISSSIPIISLSDKKSDLYDYIFPKPFNHQTLFRVVIDCALNKKADTGGSCEAPDTPPLETKIDKKRLKILIAEDEESNRLTIVDMLASLGYKNVIAVSDGKQCIEYAKDYKPDLCLMDIRMPVMNGMDAARKLKSKKLKIMAVTAANINDRKLFDGFLLKPITKDELDISINKLFK